MWPAFIAHAASQCSLSLQVDGVAAELAALSDRGVKLRPLLELLLKAAAPLALGSAECGVLLEQIITLVPLGE